MSTPKLCRRSPMTCIKAAFTLILPDWSSADVTRVVVTGRTSLLLEWGWSFMSMQWKPTTLFSSDPAVRLGGKER